MRVIAGTRGGIRLESVRGDTTRPTSDRVKESLFSILAPWLLDATVLDLFAGSGSLGIEALSRGARSALFVDQAPAAVRVIRRNLEKTQLLDRAEVWRCSVSSALNRLAASDRRFDLVFADPPYNVGLGVRTLADVAAAGVVSSEGWVIIEHASKEEIGEGAQNLTLIRRSLYGDTALSFYRSIEA